MTLIAGPNRLAVQGERVRMARSSTNLSREKFATVVSEHLAESISREIIRQIEKGERDAKMGELIAISVVTGKRVEWLAGGSNVPSDSESSYAPVAQWDRAADF